MAPNFQLLFDRVITDAQRRAAKKEQAMMALAQLQKGRQVLDKYDESYYSR